MEYRNARWTDVARTSINAEINHPDLGWIKTTLRADDPPTMALFAAASAAGPGAYAPPPQSTPQSISFIQLISGLVSLGWISAAEGEAWFRAGKLPQTAEAVIQSLPGDQRFAARIRMTRPSVVNRDDGLVRALAQAAGKTPTEMDAFFVAASTM